MSLQSQVNDDLKAAMLARNVERTNTLRLLKSALTYALIERGGGELPDDDALTVLRREANKRRDAISGYESGGRAAQAAQEQSELAIISEFLPKALSPEEVEAIVKAAIAETGATTKKDMGAVMKAATAKAGGRADGKTLSGVVMRLLP